MKPSVLGMVTVTMMVSAIPGFTSASSAFRPQSTAATTRSASDGVFTETQAKRGATVYLRECSVCHGERLGGGEGSPALVGSEFEANWYGQTVGDLFELIRATMPPPPDVPGRLTPQQYIDVVAYLLSAHKFPAGKTELPTESKELTGIRLDRNE